MAFTIWTTRNWTLSAPATGETAHLPFTSLTVSGRSARSSVSARPSFFPYPPIHVLRRRTFFFFLLHSQRRSAIDTDLLMSLAAIHRTHNIPRFLSLSSVFKIEMTSIAGDTDGRAGKMTTRKERKRWIIFLSFFPRRLCGKKVSFSLFAVGARWQLQKTNRSQTLVLYIFLNRKPRILRHFRPTIKF